MVRRIRLLATCIACSLVLVPGFSARAQTFSNRALALHVDAANAVQGILRVHETIPVSPGALTLVYPKWIPGEHAPHGPISNLAELHMRAGARDLAWQRDLVDLYAFHVTIPPATSSLDVDFVFLGGEIPGQSSARLSTPNIITLEWNKVLTPEARESRSVAIVPSITLPSTGWKYATALETTSAGGATIAFAPTTLEMLVDSPLDAGINERTFSLGEWDGAPITLAAFADTSEELAVPDATVAKFRSLVKQMHALYRYRHFRHYTFLLTMSDEMPGEGLEHHQSSDNGTRGDFLTDPSALAASADLLSHEWNHSWDGKYRRPFNLATPNLQAPMIDELLWVYEGMTQFYGNLQAERSGLRTEQQWLDSLAMTYARLNAEPGRLTHPLADTATASSIRRGLPAWNATRRSQDYYAEGEMLWLEADVTIYNLTHGKRSLDDVARAFFGNGHDSGAEVVTYNRDNLIAALSAAAPYDWATFIAQRIDAVTPHPPDPFTAAGYRVTFNAKPSAFTKLQNDRRKMLDLWWSVGISAKSDGTIVDVLTDSPAGKAGIGPGEKIVALDDRALKNQAQVDDALRAAQTGAPLRLLLSGGDVFRTATIDYRGGPRYPHLEASESSRHILDAIAKPLS